MMMCCVLIPLHTVRHWVNCGCQLYYGHSPIQIAPLSRHTAFLSSLFLPQTANDQAGYQAVSGDAVTIASADAVVSAGTVLVLGA